MKLPGPVNQGVFDFGVTYTPTADPSDGYNLIGNPYPSSIDWDDSDWTKTNIGGTIAVKDNGGGGGFQYWNGLSGGLVDGQIAAGQAFWVQTLASSPQLIADEGVKVGAGITAEFLREEKVEGFYEFVVALSKNGLVDVAYLAVHPDATAGYDAQFDALKLDNDEFDFSSFDEDGNKLAINFFADFTCEKVIRFDISDATTGTYNLDFSGFENFESGNNFVLYDDYTGDQIDVLSNANYSFDLDENESESFGASRFELHISRDFIEQNLSIESSADICEEDAGSIILLSSQQDVTYNLLINGNSTTYEVIGDGSDKQIPILNADLISGENEISIVGSVEGCDQKEIGNSVLINKNTINEAISITGSNKVCLDESGFISIDESEVDVTYQLVLNGEEYGEPAVGDGFKLDFTLLFDDLSSTNLVEVMAIKGNCEVQLLETETVDLVLLDDSISYEVNDVCAGENGSIFIPSPQQGVEYQVLLNGIEYGERNTSSGDAISFELQSSDLEMENFIQIIALQGSCEIELFERLQFSLIELDDLVTFETNDVCSGENGSIIIESPQDGVEYQIVLNGVAYGESIVADGSTITQVLQAEDLESENSIEILISMEECSSSLSQVESILKTSIEPVITQEGNILTSNYDQGNSWFLDGELIADATSGTLVMEISGFYELKVELDQCSSRIGEQFEVEQITSVEENVNSGIKFYPNPVDQQLFIESKDLQINSIEIINSNGKVVYVSEPNNSNLEIDVSGFASGIYLIRLQAAQKVSIHRFIVK